MKKKLLLTGFVVSLLFPFTAFAEERVLKEEETEGGSIRQPVSRKNAYYLTNPKNPDQKILLIGSNHRTPLTFLGPSLSKAAKQMDVFITELTNNERSWDISTTFNIISSRLFKQYDNMSLENEGFLSKDSYFKMLDTEQDWTDNLDIATKQYLHELVSQSPLKIYGLSKIHPRLLNLVLQETFKKLSERTGMDSQLDAYYMRSNKPVLGLETQKEREQLSVGYDLSPFTFTLIGEKSLVDLIHIAKKVQANKAPTRKELLAVPSISNYVNGRSEEKVTKLAEEGSPEYIRYGKNRNELWAPRIIKYLTQYSDKSFTIMVGSFHLYGPFGILELLKEQKFEIERF
ncbi:MAG: TraB/GumN family protein [Alphaproteobacteria bacterium]|nr:TraB/GumN family protein [Alphaproteobacteria bacterium]